MDIQQGLETIRNDSDLEIVSEQENGFLVYNSKGSLCTIRYSGTLWYYSVGIIGRVKKVKNLESALKKIKE